jgi:hypothetical protein
VQRLKIRHIAAAGALALIATASMTACGADSVSPLPVQAAEAEPAASATPASTTNPSATSPPAAAKPPAGLRPPKTIPVRPTSPRATSARPVSTCLGAVRKDLDLQNNELALVGPMCFHTGGVLRLQGIGPGLVNWTPRSLVSHNYAAGVVDLTFIRAGTVTVTIPQDGQTYTITVVVRS